MAEYPEQIQATPGGAEESPKTAKFPTDKIVKYHKTVVVSSH